MAGERPFLSSAGIGFDASVIRRVERHSRRLKRIASHPLHIVSAFQTFFGSDGRGTHVHLDVTDGPKFDDLCWALVSKSTPYTFLGRLPLNIARNVSLDSRLSLHAFTKLSAVTLLGGAASSTRSGRFIERRKDVIPLDDLVGMRVYADAPFPYQVDGDDAGDTNELQIAFVPDALTIAIPSAD